MERVPSSVARASEWNKKATQGIVSPPTASDMVKQPEEEKSAALHSHHQKFREAMARLAD